MRSETALGDASPPFVGEPHGAPLRETMRRDDGDPSTPLAAAPLSGASSLTTRSEVKSSFPMALLTTELWTNCGSEQTVLPALSWTEPDIGLDCSLFHVASRCTAALCSNVERAAGLLG
jgi:hypothetical protein